MMQQEGAFRPIALVLETKEDAAQFWDIINQYISVGGAASEKTYQVAVRISDWFSKEAKL